MLFCDTNIEDPVRESLGKLAESYWVQHRSGDGNNSLVLLSDFD